MPWASRATRRQPSPTVRFSSAPTGTSTASRRTKLQQHEMAQQKRVDDFLLHEAQGRARHSVRAAGLDIRSERRARSDAPYYEGCQVRRERRAKFFLRAVFVCSDLPSPTHRCFNCSKTSSALDRFMEIWINASKELSYSADSTSVGRNGAALGWGLHVGRPVRRQSVQNSVQEPATPRLTPRPR